jgi:hypothetical protein
VASGNVAYGRGEVRQGRLRIAKSNVLAAQLETLRDGPVEIRIERRVATRSQQANAYYWFVLGLFADHTGHAAEDLHLYFKAKFLAKALVVCDPHGEIVIDSTVPGSTRKLNIPEFYEYVQRVKAVAEHLGCVIPAADGSGGE